MDSPDQGDAPILNEEEASFLWASGTTPQLALRNAKLPFAVAHTSGRILVTDIPAQEGMRFATLLAHRRMTGLLRRRVPLAHVPLEHKVATS